MVEENHSLRLKFEPLSNEFTEDGCLIRCDQERFAGSRKFAE
jgi:hypothetical protein